MSYAKLRALLRLAALSLYAVTVLKWLGAITSWGHPGFYSSCGSWLMQFASARFANQRRWLAWSNAAQLVASALSCALSVLALYSYATGGAGAVFMPRIVVAVVFLKLAAFVSNRLSSGRVNIRVD